MCRFDIWQLCRTVTAPFCRSRRVADGSRGPRKNAAAEKWLCVRASVCAAVTQQASWEVAAKLKDAKEQQREGGRGLLSLPSRRQVPVLQQCRSKGEGCQWNENRLKKKVLTDNSAAHKCQTTRPTRLEPVFARLTSLCNLIFILCSFCTTPLFCWCFLPSLQLWKCHPRPYLAETARLGKENAPCWALRVSSLPCPLNKQLSLWRIHGMKRDAWEYWLAPYVLCCFILLRTRPW